MRFNSSGRSPADNAPSDLAWRVIGLVNLYRLLIAGGLFAAGLLEPIRDLLLIPRPGPLTFICALYFLAGVGLIALRRLSFTGLRLLALTHALTDSIAIAWILWATGGIQGGMERSRQRLAAKRRRNAPGEAGGAASESRVIR